MRRAVLLTIGACSFAPQKATPDGTGVADARNTDAPSDAAPDALAAPFALDGMQWVIPCMGSQTVNGKGCHCAPAGSPGDVQVVQLHGSSSEHYAVTVRIAGAMEGFQYTGGSGDGSDGWYVGGGRGGDGGDNTYEIDVSSPAQTYYVNQGSTQNGFSITFDYTATLPIDGNATVTFTADPGDSLEWQGIDSSFQPIAIAGFTAPPPENGLYGQWAYVSVLAVQPN